MKPKWWHVIEQLELSTLPLGIYYGTITLENNVAISFKVIHTHSHGASQVALVVKNPVASAGDIKRLRFHPWVGKIPWRRAWQSTPVSLPGESHGQRSLAGYSPLGHTESDLTEVS